MAWTKTNPPAPEVKIALFGASGSGKTTLLASYYGNQQRNTFEQTYGYRLEAEDTKDSRRLLKHYYGLTEGKFPDGTATFAKYKFKLKIGDLPAPGLRVTWYDYPGGWWESQPSTVEDKEARISALSELLTSHVGILLLDGEQIIADGSRYVCYILDTFKHEARRVVDTLAELGQPVNELPKTWIIAISKADLLDQEATAEDVCKEMLGSANDQLDGIGAVLNAPSFGDLFLLLSAVQGEGNRVIDASKYRGLQLIAPLGLMGILAELHRLANDGIVPAIPKTILERLRDIFKWSESFDSVLPLKLRIVSELIKALAIREGLEKSAEYFEKRQEQAKKKKRLLDATVCAMKRELASPDAHRCYHRLEPFSE